MIGKIMCSLIGYIGGRFAISYLPSFEDEFSTVIADMLFNLENLLVGMISFFVAFLFLSRLICFIIEEFNAYFKKQKKLQKSSLICIINVIICFSLLFYEDVRTTIGLLIFTIIYGIISVDFKRESHYKFEQ